MPHRLSQQVAIAMAQRPAPGTSPGLHRAEPAPPCGPASPYPGIGGPADGKHGDGPATAARLRLAAVNRRYARVARPEYGAWSFRGSFTATFWRRVGRWAAWWCEIGARFPFGSAGGGFHYGRAPPRVPRLPPTGI